MSAALYGSGLTTGLFWLLAGVTGMLRSIAKLATKPVVRGIMLGLGLTFMVDEVNRMKTAPVLAGIALVVTYLLLTNPKIPAMFMLLLIGTTPAQSAPALRARWLGFARSSAYYNRNSLPSS